MHCGRHGLNIDKERNVRGHPAMCGPRAGVWSS